MATDPSGVEAASRRQALEDFQRDIEGVACLTADDELRARARDYYWYSPVLEELLKGCRADIVVLPATEEEVVRVAGAAARHRLHLTIRGGGTGNYGQAVPLRGGVVLDMTHLNRIVQIEPGAVRVQAGAYLEAVLDAVRTTGQQLMIYPSTMSIATVGGFIAGGSAGIGAVRHGILRESGTMRSLRVVTLEESPRTLTLTGPDIELVHHAWGTNGIIIELDLALVPAVDWLQCIALFPSYVDVMRFGGAVLEAGIDVFLLSAVDRRFAPYYADFGYRFDGSADAMFSMVNPKDQDRFAALVSVHGGRLGMCMTPQDHTASGLPPVHECAYNHTTLRALKVDRSWTYLQMVVPPERAPELVAVQMDRYGDEMLMHHEFARLAGKPRISGLVALQFLDEERLDEVMAELVQDGCHVMNAHVNTLEKGGRKEMGAEELRFKRSVDPLNLMNPGKILSLQ
ncbi:FAD-binding oxidoreductase [Variovorax sp. YR216]|uniref:FAD-binding oxidoreductase n=1 Tax=Variovorax sp. YR216 TaxID=1882828 RepID=UPI00089667BB|nr:FAD-binding oxidoreductase [Variovorax sp. YR216]SEB25746.1 FAD/FMN-containing dehydrogenase [Variovorax sp. YR216]